MLRTERGYEVGAMRSILEDESERLIELHERLERELERVEKRFEYLTPAWNGLKTLEKNDVAAIEPDNESDSCIDFLRHIGINGIELG